MNNMNEFEINVNGLDYLVYPKNFENGTYSILYEGDVYKTVHMDENEHWQVFAQTTDPDLDLINEMGRAIENHYD